MQTKVSGRASQKCKPPSEYAACEGYHVIFNGGSYEIRYWDPEATGSHEKEGWWNEGDESFMSLAEVAEYKWEYYMPTPNWPEESFPFPNQTWFTKEQIDYWVANFGTPTP